MSTVATTYEVRGARRIRVFFTGPLGASAFTSTTYYAVTVKDSTYGGNILVSQVFAIASDPNAVELAISNDLVDGEIYSVTFTSLPLSPSGTYSGSVTVNIASPLQVQQDVEPEASDVDLLLYGRDMEWDGGFVTTAGGDLAVISGRDCWKRDNARRMTSNGLTWDPTYGPKAYQSVDAPDVYRLPLGAAMVANARQDDRTAQASVDIIELPSDPAGWIFALNLVGIDGLDTVSIPIPTPSVNES